MSVIIRLQNLPWSANALDIRNFFHGLSIPEGGVHIVGGELGDAFIAFSTDEDARQAMMLDGGKIKEIQVKLLLSSRSEMHKVIETARQSVPILSIAAPNPPAPVIAPPAPVPPVIPTITPFSAALGNSHLNNYGIPGIGNPNEIPQPAVIEPPAPLVSPPTIITPHDHDRDDDKLEAKRNKEKDRRRSKSRSRSRERERKDRKRDRRDRSRSRERRRRDRSRSRERRERKRDRKDRSRSIERSPSRRSRDRRFDKKSPSMSLDKMEDVRSNDSFQNVQQIVNPANPTMPQQLQKMPPNMMNGVPVEQNQNRFQDPTMNEAFNKLQELGMKRNPNAFQGEQNGGRFPSGRGGASRREGRVSRFEPEPPRECCVAIRNAPNHTSYGDVRRFFPFMIDKHGIKMINDNMGRRSGTIFVRFCDPRSKQLALQRKMNELKGAIVTVENLDDDAYDAAIDSFLPYRDDNDEEDPNLMSDDGSKPYSVLKLADLPNFVKEHDIIKNFNDFSLLSIMILDCRISRSKIAFVQFVKPDDAKAAFDRKDRYMFGRRHPTITPVTDDEFEREKMSQHEKSDIKDSIKINDPVVDVQVPRDPRQRRQFDNGPPKGIQTPPQQQQGAPFFNGPFPNQQGFMGAPFVGSTNQQFPNFPGPTNVDPRAANPNWGAVSTGPNQVNLPNSKMPPINNIEDEPMDCVLIKGLPRDASDRTILEFFTDCGAAPARIHMMLDSNGQPSGDCFCEFRSSKEARMAATKHGHNLNGFRITVDLVPRNVVEEALDGPKSGDMREGLLGNGPVQQQFFDPPQRGFGPRGPFRGRGNFNSIRGNFDNRGFASSRGFDRGFDRSFGDNGGRGNFRGRGFERGRGRGTGGRPFGRGRGPSERMLEDDSDPALEDFGAPGCVVSMENVPFRATIDDILTFFSEFELTQDDVIRRYNERGQPTGDARVAFRTPFDAQRAVKTRHMDTIYDRRINLMIL